MIKTIKNPLWYGKVLVISFCSLIIFSACSSPSPSQKNTDTLPPSRSSSTSPIHPLSVDQIPLPSGYERPAIDPGSFAEFLHTFKLKENNTVYLFDGSKKGNQNAQYAVLDLDVGNKDLQQCADAVMRLRAEYLYQAKKYTDIHFNFTSGDKASYERFAKGYRANLNGNKVSWSKSAAEDYSYGTFRKYMDLVFNYAGSSSLSKELTPVQDIHDIQSGDVFIHGGFPGHAVIVMEVAQNPATGKKIFLLAQSYMPAQDMHILKNPADENLSPWYPEDFGEVLKTPEWTFERNELKRF